LYEIISITRTKKQNTRQNENDINKSSEILFEKPKITPTEQIFLERITDWHEEGNHIQKLLHEYDHQYRKKICVNCSAEQQQKRNCVRIDMYTNDGIQITGCGHMDDARTRKYSKLIGTFMFSNPSSNRI